MVRYSFIAPLFPLFHYIVRKTGHAGAGLMKDIPTVPICLCTADQDNQPVVADIVAYWLWLVNVSEMPQGYNAG